MAATPVPTLKDIRPYPRALVVNEYEVARMERDRSWTERIHVAQWAYLDDNRVLGDLRIGDQYTIFIDPMEWYPSVAMERVISSLTNPEADLYMDAGSPDREIIVE